MATKRRCTYKTNATVAITVEDQTVDDNGEYSKQAIADLFRNGLKYTARVDITGYCRCSEDPLMRCSKTMASMISPNSDGGTIQMQHFEQTTLSQGYCATDKADSATDHCNKTSHFPSTFLQGTCPIEGADMPDDFFDYCASTNTYDGANPNTARYPGDLDCYFERTGLDMDKGSRRTGVLVMMVKECIDKAVKDDVCSLLPNTPVFCDVFISDITHTVTNRNIAFLTKKNKLKDETFDKGYARLSSQAQAGGSGVPDESDDLPPEKCVYNVTLPTRIQLKISGGPCTNPFRGGHFPGGGFDPIECAPGPQPHNEVAWANDDTSRPSHFTAGPPWGPRIIPAGFGLPERPTYYPIWPEKKNRRKSFTNQPGWDTPSNNYVANQGPWQVQDWPGVDWRFYGHKGRWLKDYQWNTAQQSLVPGGKTGPMEYLTHWDGVCDSYRTEISVKRTPKYEERDHCSAAFHHGVIKDCECIDEICDPDWYIDIKWDKLERWGSGGHDNFHKNQLVDGGSWAVFGGDRDELKCYSAPGRQGAINPRKYKDIKEVRGMKICQPRQSDISKVETIRQEFTTPMVLESLRFTDFTFAIYGSVEREFCCGVPRIVMAGGTSVDTLWECKKNLMGGWGIDEDTAPQNDCYKKIAPSDMVNGMGTIDTKGVGSPQTAPELLSNHTEEYELLLRKSISKLHAVGDTRFCNIVNPNLHGDIGDNQGYGGGTNDLHVPATPIRATEETQAYEMWQRELFSSPKTCRNLIRGIPSLALGLNPKKCRYFAISSPPQLFRAASVAPPADTSTWKIEGDLNAMNAMLEQGVDKAAELVWWNAHNTPPAGLSVDITKWQSSTFMRSEDILRMFTNMIGSAPEAEDMCKEESGG